MALNRMGAIRIGEGPFFYLPECARCFSRGSQWRTRLRRDRYFTTGDADGVDRALRAITEMKPDCLIVESDALLVSDRSRIIAFAAEQRLPTAYGNLDYMSDGGLMAYYTSIFDTWVQLRGDMRRSRCNVAFAQGGHTGWHLGCPLARCGEIPLTSGV
jgi:hypothetical protein